MPDVKNWEEWCIYVRKIVYQSQLLFHWNLYVSYVNNWEKLCIHVKEIVYICQIWKVEKDNAYTLER